MSTSKQDLSVAEAQQLVLDEVSALDARQVPLSEALGYVLAAPVVAQNDLPPFANSAMDGYALRSADIAGATTDHPVTLTVVGDIAAGAPATFSVNAGTAARIMTGAPMPEGADAVIPVEDTDEAWREAERPLPDHVAVRRSVRVGDYIRRAGEDVKTGDTVLLAGHVVRPQTISVMASLGVAQVPVVRRPRIGVLATGDELVDVDEPLSLGKIRNSNSYALAAQIEQAGAKTVWLGVAHDTEASVRQRLQSGVAAGVDLLVSSAGVSVGAYDVVKSVLDQDGEVGFWRVRMRPGKPLAFGRYAGIPYLGLPGNPVSAMVSFEMFVRPALLKMAGHEALFRPLLPVRVGESFDSDGRESYIRVVVTRHRESGELRALTTGSQGSHIITSLVQANALLIVPEGQMSVKAGEQLAAMMLDWPAGSML